MKPKWSQNARKTIENENEKNMNFERSGSETDYSAGVPQFAPVKVNLPAKKPNKTEKVK